MSTTPVTPIIEAKIGGTWVDITADCRLDSADSGGGINIKRGRANEAPVVEPTELDIVLNNRDGKYSPLNPNGPYFDSISRTGGRNVPVRVGVDRRRDDFARTVTDWVGEMPNWTDTELRSRPGYSWDLIGSASAFDVNGSELTIQATTGSLVAQVGTYADSDVTTRVKVSDRTSEFGIVLRSRSLLVAGQPDWTFESGVAGWSATGGALGISTTTFRFGAQAGTLTISGSPARGDVKSGMLPVIPGSSYKIRSWIRTTATYNVVLEHDWYDKAGAFISTTTSTVLSSTLNTWFWKESLQTAPTGAEFVRFGAAITGSPANGTVLILDNLMLQNQTNSLRDGTINWYSAYITPDVADVVRIGKITPGVSRSVSGPLGFQIVAGTWYNMRAQILGTRCRIKVWADGAAEPKAWVLSYHDPTAATESPVVRTGSVGLIAAQGSALVTFDFIQIDQWRAHAEIRQLPLRWDLSRQDKWVPVQARGILQRLNQGRKNQKSAVTLHLQSYKPSDLWLPLEEQDGATRASNAVTGGTPGVIGGLTFQAPDRTGALAFPGVSAYAHLGEDTSSITGTAKLHTSINKWTMLLFFRMPNVPASEILLFQFYSSGTARFFRVYLTAANAVRVDCVASDSTIISTASALLYFGSIPQGSWVAATLYVFNSGGTVNWAFNYHLVGGTTGFFTINNTFAGTTGIFRSITIKSSPAMVAAGGLDVAQIFHYEGDLPFVTTAFARAARAYDGELSGVRYLRIARNAGINANITGSTTFGEAMGAQLPAKTMDLLGECAEAEDALIYEGRDDFELAFRTRYSLYNQPQTTLDIDAGHLTAPLEPTPDDQSTRNDITVTRPGGASASSIQETGYLNTADPEVDVIDGVGTYDEQVEYNLSTDAQLQPVANWRRARGVQPDPRYPSMTAELHGAAYQADPTLAALAASIDSAAFIALDNPEVTPDVYGQLIQAYTEKIDQYEWQLKWTGSPAGLYTVGVADMTTRIGSSANDTVGAFISGTNTELTATLVRSGFQFVQIADSPESFPFDIVVKGVQLRVITTGRNLIGNSYFETDASGWVASAVNFAIAQDRQYSVDGKYSMRIDCVTSATGGANVTQAANSTVVAGSTYRVAGWLRSLNTITDVRIAVDWYQADGTTFIATGLPTNIGLTAGVWTAFSASLVAPALAARARLRVRYVGLIGDIVWADKLTLIEESTASGTNQILVVQQAPVNGVIKTIPTASKIEIVQPWRVAW